MSLWKKIALLLITLIFSSFIITSCGFDSTNASDLEIADDSIEIESIVDEGIIMETGEASEGYALEADSTKESGSQATESESEKDYERNNPSLSFLDNLEFSKNNFLDIGNKPGNNKDSDDNESSFENGILAGNKLNDISQIITIDLIFTGDKFKCSARSSKTSGDFKGSASLVYFYMGDDTLTTIAQETTKLSNAFTGYDHKVLMYDDASTVASKFLSASAINQADVIYHPTKDNFFNAILDTVEKGYFLDIYIISHGNIKSNGVPYFVSADNNIKGTDIASKLGDYGCNEIPIRMVYTVACYQSAMNSYWTSVGAKAVVGSQYINFYPNQFNKFAESWTLGNNFETALDKANTEGSRTVAQAYIYYLGLKYANQGDCGAWPNVLGENACAEWFFTEGGPYTLEDDYNDNKSGKQNMTISSKKIITGDETISISSEVSWNLPN
ncbi:MAG: hypothetical protein ABIA04_02170 [Pseudomonadota bacterium]